MKHLALAALAFCLGCGSMVDEENAIRAVESLGFTEATVVDKSVVFLQLAGCGEHDAVAFSVRGKNTRGNVATVTVCCGLLFKACAVRH